MQALLAVESDPVTVTSIWIHCTGNAYPFLALPDGRLANTAGNWVVELVCCCRQRLPVPPQRAMQPAWTAQQKATAIGAAALFHQ